MSRRVAAPVVLALLLVLAGCGRTAVDHGPTVGSPADATAGGNGTIVPDGEYPPGFSRSDVSVRAVRERTLTFLREDPVVVDASERFRPGAYADYHYEANATHARFRFDVHNGDADVTERDVYARPEVQYRRKVRNGRTSFDRSNESVAATRREAAPSTWAVLSRMLVFGEYRAVRSYRVDGQRRIRYELAGTSVENASDPRGHLVVDADGVVREATLAYTRGGERKRFEYAVRHRSDVVVAEPGWLPAARTDGDPIAAVAPALSPA